MKTGRAFFSILSGIGVGGLVSYFRVKALSDTHLIIAPKSLHYQNTSSKTTPSNSSQKSEILENAFEKGYPSFSDRLKTLTPIERGQTLLFASVVSVTVGAAIYNPKKLALLDEIIGNIGGISV